MESSIKKQKREILLAIDPGINRSLGYVIIEGLFVFDFDVIDFDYELPASIDFRLKNLIEKTKRYRVTTVLIEDFTYWYRSKQRQRRKLFEKNEKSAHQKYSVGSSVFISLKMKELIGFLRGIFLSQDLKVKKIQPRYWQSRIKDLKAIEELFEFELSQLKRSQRPHLISALSIALAYQGYFVDV